MKIAIVIPARLDSKRFPNKLIQPYNDTTILQYVHNICSATEYDTYVATEDEQIASLFTYNTIQASGNNGTERCANAARNIGYDGIINVQGDFVGVTPELITAVARELSKQMRGSGRTVITAHDTLADADINDRNNVKVILARPHSHTPIRGTSAVDDVLWFTREPISYGEHHFGIYGYQKSDLEYYMDFTESAAETSESLEQLRWLEIGFKFKSIHYYLDNPVSSINVAEDLKK